MGDYESGTLAPPPLNEYKDGSIIEREPITVGDESIEKLVEAPYKKVAADLSKPSTRLTPMSSKKRDANNNNTTTNNALSAEKRAINGQLSNVVLFTNGNNDLSMRKWLSELKSEETRRSLPTKLSNKEFVEKREKPDEVSYKPSLPPQPTTAATTTNFRKETPSSNLVQSMRTRLFTLSNDSLRNIIISPLKLSDLRNLLAITVRSTLNDSVEQFVLESFAFFSTHLFFKLINEVKIEWSYRLKS